jgi:hypothetical protein
MLLNAAAGAKTHLGGLKMVVGGSELSKVLAKQALAAGIDVFAGYGMSETGPLVDPERELDIRVRAGIHHCRGNNKQLELRFGRFGIVDVALREPRRARSTSSPAVLPSCGRSFMSCPTTRASTSAVLFDRAAFAGSSAFAKSGRSPRMADARGYALPISNDLARFAGLYWRRHFMRDK